MFAAEALESMVTVTMETASSYPRWRGDNVFEDRQEAAVSLTVAIIQVQRILFERFCPVVLRVSRSHKKHTP